MAKSSGIGSKFDDLKARIQKNVKGAHVSVLSQSEIATNNFYVETPCMDLNRILSGNLNRGIKSRNLMAIIGPEHSMKSSFMILCMVNAQKQGYKPVVIDTEGGLSKDFCMRWGLDPDEILYVYTPWIHEVQATLAQIKDTGEQEYVIGLDSVGGLNRWKAYDDALKGETKQDQGLLQKEIRSMLKLFLNICIGQNSIGIASGHYYGKPSSVPMPDQIGGGKAMKLFPSIIVTLKKEQLQETKGGPITGNKITATTIKNRVYPPYQQALVELDFVNGVQKYAGIIDLGVKSGFIVKNGSWYSYMEERLGQGESNATKALEGDIGKEVIANINTWLESTGYSEVNEAVKEAEALMEEEEKNV